MERHSFVAAAMPHRRDLLAQVGEC